MLSPLLLMIEEAIKMASQNMASAEARAADAEARAAEAEAKASQPVVVEDMTQAELAELTRQVLRLVEKRFIDRFTG